MAIRWPSKIVLFKPETTYGTDPTPTAAANGVLMKNVVFSPMAGGDVSRDLEFAYLCAQDKIPVGLHVRLKGSVELQGSGTVGTPPAWGSLLRACGVAETINAGTSVVYNPITNNQESGALYFWVGNTRHKVMGCRVDGTLGVNAQDIPTLDVEIVGLYAKPGESAPTLPTLTAFQRPLVATKANTPVFTVNGVSLAMRNFRLALRNEIVPRMLVGREEILIVDRQEEASTRVEAVPLTTFDPFSLSDPAGGSLVPVALTHGTTAGRIAALSMPNSRIGRMGDYQQADKVLEWDLPLIPLPSAGNDQWTLTLT